jgi:uncharacterized alpha-E superfamily protein
LNRRTRYEFLKRIVLVSQTLAGVLDGTMSRTDAYTFMMLGRNLERADMTSRIVDVRSAQILPAATSDLGPFQTIQWISVLRTLTRSSGVLDTLAGAHRFLTQVSFAEQDQQGLHQLIDHLQVYLIGVHASIAQAYFPSHAGNARRPLPQSQAQDGGSTLPLFADAP